MSTSELAKNFADAYKTVEPLADALNDSVREFVKKIKAFHRENRIYSNDSKFGWINKVNSYVSINPGNITDDGFYINCVDHDGYADEVFVPYELVDNVDTILAAYAVEYKAHKDSLEVKYKAARRADLEAALAALDS